MSWVPRVKGKDIHFHIIARCNNGEKFLSTAKDREQVVGFLRHYSKLHRCELYNYVIMPSHVHIMLMTAGCDIDVVMHDFCLAVARDYNKRHKRSGHFWRHPFRSKVIDDDRYAIACLRYIHRNPVAAGLVHCPEDWPWSAYKFYVNGTPDNVLTKHPSYYLLGRTDKECRKGYHELMLENSAPASAEYSLFEIRCREGSRRFRLAYKQAIDPIVNFLFNHRY